MEHLQHIIDQIPIRHNVISQFELLGIFQGFFISSVILLKTYNKKVPIKFLGLFLLIYTLVLLDSYLCYTGLMKYVIDWNDSTEPLVLLWAPLFYLFILGVLERKPFNFRKHWHHFLLPLVYFITQFGYYMHPKSVKLYAYLSAYFPDSERPDIPVGLNFWYQNIKDHFRWILLISFLIYTFLSLRVIIRNSKKSFVEKAKKDGSSKLKFSKNLFGLFIILLPIVIVIYLNFENDLGDHYISILQTIFLFSVSFMLLFESRFFEKSWLADKYETLTILEEPVSILDIKKYIEKESYFISESVSLKNLSGLLGANPNYVSKIINQSTGKNFNDFINEYRVELSKQRLMSDDFKHLTIEAIGNSVGFKSKSAFYSAFKKQTQTSPTVFIQEKKVT